MKWIFSFFFILVSNVFALDAEVANIQSAISSKDPQRIGESLTDLRGEITGNLNIDDSSDLRPSEAKVKAFQKVKAALLPVKPALVALVNESNKSPDYVAHEAALVLGYSDGGAEVYNALKNGLASGPPYIWPACFDALNRLGMADATVRKIASDKLRYWNGKDLKEAIEAGLIVNMAGYWKLPEGMPIFVAILKSDGPLASKIAATEALKRLGPEAKEALPILRQLLERAKTDHGPFSYVSIFSNAISVISGEVKPIY